MSTNKSKFSLKNGGQVFKNYKINRYDPNETEPSKMEAQGIKSLKQNDMEELINHNYLRKSMEQRVQRKALLDSFKKMRHSIKNNASSKETLSSKLRS